MFAFISNEKNVPTGAATKVQIKGCKCKREVNYCFGASAAV